MLPLVVFHDFVSRFCFLRLFLRYSCVILVFLFLVLARFYFLSPI
nr:MAG TPA: hypothetical protein [Caudoviricetes sp.]